MPVGFFERLNCPKPLFTQLKGGIEHLKNRQVTRRGTPFSCDARCGFLAHACSQVWRTAEQTPKKKACNLPLAKSNKKTRKLKFENFQVPTSYAQEMAGLSPDYGNHQPVDYRYSAPDPSSMGLGIPLVNTCLPNTSLTSSPACSD